MSGLSVSEIETAGVSLEIGLLRLQWSEEEGTYYLLLLWQ
jgi:hypothetical protein